MLGIGRNEFIDIMNKCRSKVRQGTVGRGVAEEGRIHREDWTDGRKSRGEWQKEGEYRG